MVPAVIFEVGNGAGTGSNVTRIFADKSEPKVAAR